MVTKRLQYRYDAVGNKVGMTDADGGLFTYTYDVMRRLTGVINPLGERTTYVYDLNGRRTSVQLANGTRTSYSYDQGSRVQQIHTLKSNNSTVAKFDYAYDDNGRRTSVLEAVGSRVTWTYDGTSQVTSEWRTGTSPFRHTFVYDTRGNRTLKVEDGARTTLVYDAANQLSSSEDAGGTTNYTYDANGNQHVTVAPGGSRTTQIWDYENRLVKTLQPGGGVSTMAYDADGLRVRKETPSEAKLFVWDDQNYLAETDDSGVTEVAYTTEPSTYGSTISHRTGGATTTYHFDALAAARVLTNTSETVLESYNYTAFGTIVGTPTLLTPFLWGGLVGYYWDADLATQYIRARHYQPHIARWISLDPIGFAGGDANLFRYVGNSPTEFVDQQGLFGEAGHFYLTWIVARACGIADDKAFRLAYFAELPDEVKAYDAMQCQIAVKYPKLKVISGRECGTSDEVVNSPRWRDLVHKYLHALHDGNAEYSTCFRKVITEMIAERINSPLESEKNEAGVLLHTLGDTFAHRYETPPGSRCWRAYPPGEGHGWDFYWPDLLTYRLRDWSVQDYITSLKRLFGGKCDEDILAKLIEKLGVMNGRLDSTYNARPQGTGSLRVDPETDLMLEFANQEYGYNSTHGYDPASKLNVLPGLMVEFDQMHSLIHQVKSRLERECSKESGDGCPCE